MIFTTFEAGDVDVMCAGDADSEIRLRFEFPPDFVPSPAHSAKVVERWQRERAAATRFTFAVRHEATRQLLGGCELRPLGDGSANVSYWTYPPHRRRGVATEAVRLLCDLASSDFGFTTLQAEVAWDNTASQKVLIANGFQTDRIASLRISRWVKKFTAGSSR